jgi:predicted glycogen debranching enzyme
MIALTREILGDFDVAAAREWLVTNGLGGYACGTVAGANTRRYHGLLVAALRPPVERTVMVAKLEAVAIYRGQRFELGTNEYADGTVAPRGYVHLDSFRLDGLIPVWTWLLGDAALEQRIWMPQGANTTYVQYTLLRGDEPVRLELSPLCTYRDYHAQLRGAREMLVSPLAQGVQIDSFWGAQPYRILSEHGTYLTAPEQHWNFRRRAESERGLDDLEDLFRPAIFDLALTPGESAALAITAEADAPVAAAESLAREQTRQEKLAAPPIPQASDVYRRLALAADQYIVERRGAAAGGSHTVIAGYPWFSDWGRDTMIALPGLTLATRRFDVAASVLRTFAQFVSDGMLPNRFPDAGETPEYNTADATLWFFVAIDEYVRASGDHALLAELYPTLRSIIRWHQRGARYGIRVDERDGLLHVGEPGVQLTWMDAKIGDWVVTPRTGKPVEINALWCNALAAMRDFSTALRDLEAARDYASAAERVMRTFNERFWFERGGYLYDVVDSPEGDDASLRPNQLFAVSLRHALLDNGRARSVVDACARALWTPVGMRSLAPADARYSGRYVGGPHERDAVYHQGTAWSWLLGPFVLAHYRVYGDAPRALGFLDGVAAHLRDACVGQISEIFDGDPPFTPRGCFAQAWSVAEILRAWSEIYESEADRAGRGQARAAIPAR